MELDAVVIIVSYDTIQEISITVGNTTTSRSLSNPRRTTTTTTTNRWKNSW